MSNHLAKTAVALLSLSLLAGAGSTAGASTQAEGGYETVVTGSRTERALEDAPVQTIVIGRREIEASGAQDLSELLDSIPGVYVDASNDFGAGVEIQGLSSRHVLILVDGERVNGRKNDRVDLSRLRLENVAQVEIVKGAASALYGSEAMGGVIHLRTRRAGRPLEGNAEIRAGTQGYSASASGASAGKDSLFRLTVGHRHHEPYRLDPDAIGTTGSETDDTNVDLRAEHRFSDAFSVTATASYFHRDQQGVDHREASRAIFDNTTRIDQVSLTIGPRFRLSEDASLSFSLHGGFVLDQFRQDQRGSTALDQLHRTEDVLMQGSAQWDQRIADHNVTVGVDLLHESLETPRLPEGSHTRFRPAVFAQDDWKITEDFAVTLGIRADYDSWFYGQVSPKAASRWTPVQWLTLRASYGHGFRAPDFKEMLILFENPSVGYRVQGNPDLQPETSRSVNVGASVQATRWMRLDVNFFHHQLENLILSVPLDDGGPSSSMVFSYRNIGRAFSRGVEASVGLRVARQVRLDLGYTYTDARDLIEDRALDGRAPHRVTFSSTWKSDFGPSVTARGEWVSERVFHPLEQGSREVVGEPYVFLNLRAQQPIVEGISLLGGVDNVFDAGDPGTLPIRPRTYWAGVSFVY